MTRDELIAKLEAIIIEIGDGDLEAVSGTLHCLIGSMYDHSEVELLHHIGIYNDAKIKQLKAIISQQN